MNSTTSTSRGWIVAGAAALTVSICLGAYALSLAGFLELAASGMSFFLLTLARMLLPSAWAKTSGASAFSRTGELIRSLVADYSNWIEKRPVPARAGIALGLTIVFLVLRYIMATLIGLVSSWWAMSAVAAFILALFLAPELFRTAVNAFSSDDKPAADISSDTDNNLHEGDK